MNTELFDYHLPPELIAQTPPKTRAESRLLVFDRASGRLEDKNFTDIISYITSGDCLVLNNTKVLPARFFAIRKTGANIEGLFLSEPAPNTWLVMLKNAQKVKPGETISLFSKDGGAFLEAKAIERTEPGHWLLKIISGNKTVNILDRIGFAPLPPYIKRTRDTQLDEIDIDRYQTVFAKETGAVAAPTAGLHFTEKLLAQIKAAGTDIAYITLHVGEGTFKPVTADNLDDHKMHTERFTISAEAAETINNTARNGGRVIAVGTTSVRTLEAVAQNRTVAPTEGSTELFIRPGYQFKIVDAMITNFHLPKSTLLALVAAFAGLDNILTAYKHAIENNYRFYSYGDAMLIT
jgi:S-adenosylmethionine:tRNA ribosyltransferase-isomerase